MEKQKEKYMQNTQEKNKNRQYQQNIQQDSKYSGSPRRQKHRRCMILCIAIIIIVAIAAGALLAIKKHHSNSSEVIPEVFAGWSRADYTDIRPELDVELLTPNEYSRPQTPLEQVKGIVIHYTANPGASAINNRSYFEGLKDSHDTYASSHFVVGLQGEIVQCVPTNEVAYASNNRNSDTISIEVCHPDETGEFTKETYNALVELTGWLCLYLDVDPNQVIRHYDVTGKLCPLYYVEHEDAWETFKSDVYVWAKSHEKSDE